MAYWVSGINPCFFVYAICTEESLFFSHESKMLVCFSLKKVWSICAFHWRTYGAFSLYAQGVVIHLSFTWRKCSVVHMCYRNGIVNYLQWINNECWFSLWNNIPLSMTFWWNIFLRLIMAWLYYLNLEWGFWLNTPP